MTATAPAPTTVAAPPQQPAAGGVAAARPTGTVQASRRMRGALRKTPGKLWVAAVIASLAGLSVGLVGLVGALGQSGQLEEAAAATQQLVGAQDVRNSLVGADATATNAFLVGGLEPAQERARYDAQVDDAAVSIAGLAAAEPQDAGPLGVATSGLTLYTGLVEQARANNRQGFPVGAAYLDQASVELRAGLLPALDTVSGDSTDRVAGAVAAAGAASGPGIAAVVAGLALVCVMIWLARRTRRRLNGGLVLSFVVVVATGVLGTVLLGTVGSRAQDIRDHEFQSTLDVSQALALATDAKSMESFTLIKRGSGQKYEETFQSNVAAASEALTHSGEVDPQLATLLDEWVGAHQEIRSLDDGGDWDAAVALATDTSEGSPNADFRAFADAAGQDVEASAAATDDALASARTMALVFGALLLVAGVIAAGAALRGFNARLKEYR